MRFILSAKKNIQKSTTLTIPCTAHGTPIPLNQGALWSSKSLFLKIRLSTLKITFKKLSIFFISHPYRQCWSEHRQGIVHIMGLIIVCWPWYASTALIDRTWLHPDHAVPYRIFYLWACNVLGRNHFCVSSTLCTLAACMVCYVANLFSFW